MAKMGMKKEKKVKTSEEIVQSEKSEVKTGKIKKKNKKNKNAAGDLENTVKTIVKNGNSTKETDIAKALNVQEQLVKKKKKIGQKKEKKQSKEPADYPEAIKGNVELPDELVGSEVLANAVSAAKEAIEKERSSKDSKGLFDEDLRYALQIISMKTPDMPGHARRV